MLVTRCATSPAVLGRVVRNSPPLEWYLKGSKFPSCGGVPEGRGGSADFVAVLQSICRPEPRQSPAGHAEVYSRGVRATARHSAQEPTEATPCAVEILTT